MIRRKNWLEWTVFALGLVLIAATLGFLTYDALTRGTQPPDLYLTLGEPQDRTGRFLLPVRITNRGETTAEDVHVEVKFQGPEGEERARLEFPFVPRHASRQGWVSFQIDPAQGRELEGVVLGYREGS